MTEKLRETVAVAQASNEAGVATSNGTTLLDRIRKQQPEIARALPSHLSAERFVRIALTECRRNPKLLSCSEQSVLGALMQSAQLGLEPGPLGHAYLVPFRNNKTNTQECTFIVGYRGLIDLARRSGNITSIYAEPVFEGDAFGWELGLHRDITHRPVAEDREDAKKVTHVYAVAHVRDADPQFVVLTRRQIEATRKRSRASDSGPWQTDWVAMACKTAVRRLASFLPLSVQTAQALEVDEAVGPATDVDFQIGEVVEDATS